jgi:hypothetical protein
MLNESSLYLERILMMYSLPWFTKEPNKGGEGEEIKWYEFKKYNGLEKK